MYYILIYYGYGMFVRFVTLKSVEEVIQKIQERKLKLASDVLHG